MLKRNVLLASVFVVLFFSPYLGQAQTNDFSANYRLALNYAVDTEFFIPYLGLQTKYVLDFFELSGSLGAYLIVPTVSLDAHVFYPISLSDDTQMRPYAGGGVAALIFTGIAYEAHATLGLEFISDDIGYFFEAKPTINLAAPESSNLQLLAGFNIYSIPTKQ